MSTYVHGNVVRKVATPEERTQTRSKRHARSERHKVLHMNRGYVVFLAVAAIAALLFCVLYLQLQSKVSERSQYISKLQREIVNAREENTTKNNEIINSMNLEEIHDKAMNEFGMVYATPEQVIEYSSPEEESVKQYSNIPESGIVANSEVLK